MLTDRPAISLRWATGHKTGMTSGIVILIILAGDFSGGMMVGFDDDRVMQEYDAALDDALVELLVALPPDDFTDFSDWLWEVMTQESAALLPQKVMHYDWAQFGPPLWST
jgi:hypothetical protein